MDQNSFDGDRPIRDGSEDRLGFAAVAKHMAHAIAELSSPQGFVIGFEGAWGSGKSSLTNLTAKALEKMPNGPKVIRFSPWLIKSRDALLKELFIELQKVTTAVDATDDAASKKRKERLRALLKGYEKHLEAVGDVAEFVKDSGIPGAKFAAWVLRRGQKEVSAWASKERSLEEQKQQLADELARLPAKVVVFVDDLDRLEPTETGEVLRLVRAVADFPNVVYALCYSREVLAQNLASLFSLKEDKGNEYIDKIVQTSFHIPRPEAFDLRRMFHTELKTAYPQMFDSLASKEVLDRLEVVIDNEGGRVLTTPRHVVRAMNALRLYLDPVIDLVDFADAVWLQLNRLQSLPMFQWVESYMAGVSALAGGASIREEASKTQAKELSEILQSSGFEGEAQNRRFSVLKSLLPGLGIASSVGSAPSWKLFDGLRPETLAELVADRRLGSPQHYRYYFAFARPARAISDSEFGAFVRACASDPDEAPRLFSKMATARNPQGGVLADALLDRLQGNGLSHVPTDALPGLLLSLARGMDAAGKTTGSGDWGKVWIWSSAEKVLAASLRRLDQARRQQVLAAILAEGGLGWLTQIFREEIFSHGIFGDRKKPESERLFSPQEFSQVREVLLNRYAALKAADLIEIPNSIQILYAWMQAIPQGLDVVRAWIAHRLTSANDFLQVLHTWRSWRAVNGQVSYPLNKSVVGRFLDFDTAKARLSVLAAGDDQALSQSAAELLNALVEDGED